VKVKVKPYNSFCVDKLFVGPEPTQGASSADLPSTEQPALASYLQYHALDYQVLSELGRGRYQARPHIPLASQTYRGKVKEVKSSSGCKTGADVLLIEADGLEEGPEGQQEGKVVLEADRSMVYVYGNWMGRADLNYVLKDGKDKKLRLLTFMNAFAEEVCFEYSPVFVDAGDQNGARRAVLVWLGDPDDRPCYVGISHRPHVTAKMDSSLWTFARAKNMDEKMFRALVSEAEWKNPFRLCFRRPRFPRRRH